MIPSVWIPFTSLLCHLIGDFCLQSDWIDLNKNKKTFQCLIHILIYTTCFLVLTTSWKALLFIGATHFLFDRFPIIVKKLIFWKNHFPCGYPIWKQCDHTGYYDNSPYKSYKEGKDLVWDIFTKEKWGNPRYKEITWWLYIISDNTLHLLCNFIALTFLT